MSAALSIAPCARCAKSCLIRSPSLPLADTSGLATLVPATAPGGLCEECAAHWWIFSRDGLRWAFSDGPGVLAQPNVQAALGRVLGLMHPALAQLDWERLLAQWDLPWPPDWELPGDG